MENSLIIRCHNLRPSPSLPRTLIPVPALKTLHTSPLKPLATATLPCGTPATLAVHHPVSDSAFSYPLYVITPLSTTQNPPVAAIPHPPLCALHIHAGWIIMTSHGPYSLTTPDSIAWNLTHLAAEPSVSLSAEPASPLSLAIPSFTLSSVQFSGSDTPRIPASQTQALSQTLSQAYDSLIAQAHSSGLWCQPIVAHYIIHDSLGNTLYTSQPRLLAPTSGFQCTDPISTPCTRSDSSVTAPALSIPVETFRIRLDIKSLGPFTQNAATVSVRFTPLIHPVDPAQTVPLRITKPSSTTPSLTFALPGTTHALATEPADIFRADLIRQNTAALILSTDTGLPSRSLPTAPGTYTLSLLNTDTQTSPIIKSKKIPDSPLAPSRLFSARSVTSSADTVIWADITPLLPTPDITPLPTTSAAEPPDWTGTIQVTLADGSVSRRLIGYPAPFPSSLPPLIVYPHTQATHIDIWAQNIDTDSLHHAHIPLSPLPSTNSAAYTSPRLKPIPLSEIPPQAYPSAPPGSQYPHTRQPGQIIISRSHSPLSPVASDIITHAPVTALAPAVRTSSWDHSRSNFYAASTAGTFAISLSPSRSTPSAALIHPEPVSAPAQTAHAPHALYILTDSGTLLSLTASRPTVIATGIESPAPSIAWSEHTRSLWILSSPEHITAIPSAYPRLSPYTISAPPSSVAITSLSHTPFITSPSGLLTPATLPAATTAVELCILKTENTDRSLRHKPWTTIPLTASHIQGSISLLTAPVTPPCAGSDAPIPIHRCSRCSSLTPPIASLIIRGPVNAPLPIRITRPPRPYTILSLSALASPDFSLKH